MKQWNEFGIRGQQTLVVMLGLLLMYFGIGVFINKMDMIKIF